jgi:hypothetical protein
VPANFETTPEIRHFHQKKGKCHVAKKSQKVSKRGLVDLLNQRKPWKEQWIRALQPFGKDNALLLAVNRGEFLLQCPRNLHLQTLFTAPRLRLRNNDGRGAWVSRHLRILSAHGLIQ